MKRLLMLSAMAATMFISGARAGTIYLVQGGWDQGGPLQVAFTGDDLNLDGGVEASELTAFQAIFALPGGGTATWSLPDLGTDGFFYTSPFEYFIKADNAEHSLYDISYPEVTFGMYSDFTGSVVALTDQPLQGAVPEPGTAMLFAIPALGLVAAVRRRRADEGRERV